MAYYGQVSRGSQPYTDVIAYNNSATAIPAGYVVVFETVSGHPEAVKLPTVLDKAARTAGITVTSIGATGFGLVCRKGPAVVYGASAVSTGGFVRGWDGTAVTGYAYALSGTNNANACCLGQALLACAASGDAFLVDVNISPATSDVST
jgi:hypothetical protein